jgi:hypothetical protein
MSRRRTDSRHLATCLLALASLLPLTACARQATLVDVQVQNQDSGGLLQRLPHGGRDYIEGQPGERFAVVLQNLTAERVLTVLSVDGVNAISGQTAGGSQAGYVLEPWQRIEVRGWRKNYSDIAEFYFTDLPDSYAARTGRPQNVGVIGVAAFRERRYEPVPQYQPRPQIGRAEDSSAPAPVAESRSKSAGAHASADAAATARAPYGERRDRDQMAAQELGTGHGERRYDPVTSTHFQRESARPNQVVALYYDSYQALVARGVIPGWRGSPGRPDPFPVGFVPDPAW